MTMIKKPQDPIDTHVGSRIRLRRQLLNLSQESLGHLMGLTFQQVQKYERGANRVSASRLYDLLMILDVPISFFYDDLPADLAQGGADSSLMAEPKISPETQNLLDAYWSIPDDKLRRRLRDLALHLGKAGDFAADVAVAEAGFCQAGA